MTPLAVAFHVALLEVGREAVHVLVVGEESLGVGAKEIVVPEADEAEGHGKIFFRRRVEEVLIHGVGAGEEFLEILEANAEGDE